VTFQFALRYHRYALAGVSLLRCFAAAAEPPFGDSPVRLTESRLRRIIREELIRESKTQTVSVGGQKISVEFLGLKSPKGQGSFHNMRLVFAVDDNDYSGRGKKLAAAIKPEGEPQAGLMGAGDLYPFDAQELAEDLVAAVKRADSEGASWWTSSAADLGEIMPELVKAMTAMKPVIEPALKKIEKAHDDYERAQPE